MKLKNAPLRKALRRAKANGTTLSDVDRDFIRSTRTKKVRAANLKGAK